MYLLCDFACKTMFSQKIIEKQSSVKDKANYVSMWLNKLNNLVEKKRKSFQ